MNFKDYQAEASKTIPANFTKEQMIENAIYGLIGEFGEVVDLLKKAKFQGHALDKEKAILELGDVLWYLAELATGFNSCLFKVFNEYEPFLYNRIYNPLIEEAFLDFFDAMGDLMKYSFYRTDLDGLEAESNPLLELLGVICFYAKKFDTTIEEVASKNIEKLRARYGEKFDPEKSINRSANDE